MNRRFVVRSCTKYLASLAMCLLPVGHTVAADHPLDPLGYQEYWTVLKVLRADGLLDEETRFSYVNLREPPKEFVWNWKAGEPYPRHAFAVVRQGRKTYEAVIDLEVPKVDRWTEVLGAQPSWLGSEFFSLEAEIKSHPDFITALERRGIEDAFFIGCSISAPPNFGLEEYSGKRIGHASCHDSRDARNTWVRGIGGLTIVVDMHERKVLEVVDDGPVSLSDTYADYDPASIGATRNVPGTMYVTQPGGPGFVRNGNVIEWQNWRFHVRGDRRVGTVVSTVTYQDGKQQRYVMYQGSMSELYVPYMDPEFLWANRAFVDAGEFNAGGTLKPLLPGQDCPRHAAYLDDLVADGSGRPKPIPRLLCIFEREAGNIAWRHTDTEPESRAMRDLVIRSVAVFGNYDYVFDWTFRQDGTIAVRIGATGIVESKPVDPATAADDTTEGSTAADAYGHFVDRHTVGVNHDHYFSFRLDMDVDGPINSLEIDHLRAKELPADHPRRSIWVAEPSFPQTEREAKLNINLKKPALWRVLSANARNKVEYPTSYHLAPGKTAETLMGPDDKILQRAGFIAHHLWVTPVNPSERYAAGQYPTFTEPGKGLPEWTRANRNIANTDIVLWHTVGMHHFVRTEDWPIMPTLWHGFELRPFDFFDQNPAMDLPK